MKKFIWASALLFVVLLLAVLGYRHRNSNSEPATTATNAPQPAQVERGVPAGPAASATIGAAGGALQSSDGRLAISIPPSALSADTAVSIQPLTDTEGIAVGPVYQLSPEGTTFAQPVTLTWQLSDADLAGHQITDVVIATREGDSGWSRQGGVTRDPSTKTVKVSATHFSSWAGIWKALLPTLEISPSDSTVTVTSSLSLQSMAEEDLLAAPVPKKGSPDDELLAPPVPPKGSPDDELLATPAFPKTPSDDDLLATPVRATCTNWRVNGIRGGNSTWGTIRAGENDFATFVAPAKVPSRNPVAVSCEAFFKRSKVVAIANVTIKDRPSGWHGNLEYTYSESHSTTTPNGAGGSVTNFSTESRTVKGEFNATTDSMGWGSLDGTGNGNAQVITTYGMRNSICSSDGGSSVAGDLKVGVSGSVGSGAGSVTISAASDNLDGEQHLTDNCSKQSKPQSSHWSAAFGTSCNFVGVDFSKGGTYEADVPADNGHGKCKLTIAPK